MQLSAALAPRHHQRAGVALSGVGTTTVASDHISLSALGEQSPAFLLLWQPEHNLSLSHHAACQELPLRYLRVYACERERAREGQSGEGGNMRRARGLPRLAKATSRKRLCEAAACPNSDTARTC
ncbi:hypothetical protein AAFF_G00271270 [Aldrovandia affinis]|uniref:Uncharacterized protein n=1 Tax=Aldrovandia affinis TaxID=143900 RepID=A0AAD7RB64_9TELE|nr:hypothetical protein AAFF_G00271270 [Aldrovandia affinis]